MPIERQGSRNDLYDMVKSCSTNFEIMEENSQYLLRLNDIERTKQVVKAEEYRSQFRIYDILNYLDRYPLELPCRHTNKQACFTKICILSNIDITEQYPTIQIEEPEIWEAFMCRINKVIKFPPKINYEQRTIDNHTELNTHHKAPFDL